MITVSGTLSSLSSDVIEKDNGGVITYDGTSCELHISTADIFVTYNVSDYQCYAVQLELFDYAASELKELSSPTYEFTVEAGNFIFAQEFSRFRERIALGKGIYLRLSDERVIKPYIIEFEIDFENRSNFSLVFSNRFKRFSEINSLKNLIQRTYSSSRSIDASRHSVNQTVGQMSYVSRLMQEQIDSAKNTILAARNQSVLIDGAGIHVSCDDADDEYIRAFELRIVNGMIAMSKDNWNSVDVAIGVFKTSSGYHEGVNAHVLAGDMIIGHDLIIENPLVDAQGRETGVMQFKIDSSGAWLNNSTFVLQKDSGGKMIIDPKYGLVAGTGALFSVDGTTVTPTFVDANGEVEFDSDGMPRNTNFFLDARNGNAYFRGDGVFSGTVHAKDGEFEGVIRASDFQKFVNGKWESMLTDEGKWQEQFLDLSEIGGRVETCENGYKVTIENYTQTIDGYVQQVSEFSQTVNGFQTTVSEFRDDVDGYTEQVSQFNQTVDGFSTTVSNYTTAVNGYSRQVASFDQTVNGFNATVESYEEELDGYSRDVASYSQSVNGFSQQVASYSQSVNGYREQVSTFSQSVDGFEATVSQYEEDVEGYKEEVSQAMKFDKNGVILTTYTPLGSKAVHFGNGNFDVYGGRFQVFDDNGTTTYGYMGHGTGLAGSTKTDGVIMASGKYSDLGESDYYMIVTNAGVRMQAPGHSLYITSGGAVYDGNPLGAALFL